MPDASNDEMRLPPDPNEKLIRVFDTEKETEAIVVRGLLESYGIDAKLNSLDAPQDVLPGVGGSIILVREPDAEKARRVIEEYRQAPEDSEVAGFGPSEDPQAED